MTPTWLLLAGRGKCLLPVSVEELGAGMRKPALGTTRPPAAGGQRVSPVVSHAAGLAVRSALGCRRAGEGQVDTTDEGP